MKKIIGRIAAVLAVVLLAGCASPYQDGQSTDFKPDTVFTVGARRVSLAEWYLYALPVQESYERMYGAAVFGYPSDDSGTPMADAVREEIRRKITSVKIVSDRAEELGITLSEDEQLELSLRTEDYMNALGEEMRAVYGITRDDIYGVYADNVLAMKVYEQLTLNVDMSVPDRDVRHMVLQYVMIPKTYEDRRGNTAEYTKDELAMMREDARGRVALLRETPGVTLTDAVAEHYVPIEIVADYEELAGKLPAELADMAFAMEDGQISDVYETDEAFYILDCVKRTDSITTDIASRAVIDERQKTLFESEYERWEAKTLIKYNYPIWDALLQKAVERQDIVTSGQP